MITLGRRITRDGFISYTGNEYSVPEGLISSEIQIRASLEQLHLFQDGELVATHPVQEGRRLRRVDPRHRSKNGSHPLTQEPPLDVFHQLIEVQQRSLEVGSKTWPRWLSGRGVPVGMNHTNPSASKPLCGDGRPSLRRFCSERCHCPYIRMYI